MLEEMEYWHEDEATCPYCGHKDHDSWELDDEDNTVECDCGGTYDVVRNVSVTYTSVPVAPPALDTMPGNDAGRSGNS